MVIDSGLHRCRGAGPCRFRAAKDSQDQQAEAERKGIIIDKDALFDSNCITPGTEFMALVSPAWSSLAR